MLTKTKIALAATLFAATSSVAMAQGFDPNHGQSLSGLAAPLASRHFAVQNGRAARHASVRARAPAAGPQCRADQPGRRRYRLGIVGDSMSTALTARPRPTRAAASNKPNAIIPTQE